MFNPVIQLKIMKFDNIVIESINDGDGIKIKNYFNNIGYDTSQVNGMSNKTHKFRYYYITTDNRLLVTDNPYNNIPVITVDELLFQPKTGDYVFASNDRKNWCKTIYLYTNNSPAPHICTPTIQENLFLNGYNYDTYQYKFIKPYNKIIITPQDIASKFSVDINDIEIKLN